jgi:hypothetical protein
MRITINQGETLGGLARKYGTSVDEILKLNPQIKNPDLIQSGASLSLPGEGKSLPDLPSEKSLDGSAPIAKELPDVPAPTSRLMRYSNVLNEAVNISRTKRRKAQGDQIVDGVPEGVRSASDLTGLMKGINTVDENFIKPLTDTAIDTLKEEVRTITDVAKVAGQNGADATTLDKILAADDVGGAIKAAGGFYKDRTSDPLNKDLVDAGLKYTPNDVSTIKDMLVNGTVTSDGITFGGKDPNTGFADPKLYKKLHDNWVNSKGTSEGFVKEFPPKFYVDPSVKDELPLYLRNTTKDGNELDSALDGLFGDDE